MLFHPIVIDPSTVVRPPLRVSDRPSPPFSRSSKATFMIRVNSPLFRLGRSKDGIVRAVEEELLAWLSSFPPDSRRSPACRPVRLDTRRDKSGWYPWTDSARIPIPGRPALSRRSAPHRSCCRSASAVPCARGGSVQSGTARSSPGALFPMPLDEQDDVVDRVPLLRNVHGRGVNRRPDLLLNPQHQIEERQRIEKARPDERRVLRSARPRASGPSSR